MSATATLNIRLPEELKEHGMQVLARQHISVSEAVRQLFCELERSQQVPEFLADASPRDDIQGKRQLFANHGTAHHVRHLTPLSPPSHRRAMTGAKIGASIFSRSTAVRNEHPLRHQCRPSTFSPTPTTLKLLSPAVGRCPVARLQALASRMFDTLYSLPAHGTKAHESG